jgi:hypothetical protein
MTPAFALSLLTSAIMDAVAPTMRDDGGTAVSTTEIGCAGVGVMVIVAETDFVLSETEVAVMITAAPLGTVGGAV